MSTVITLSAIDRVLGDIDALSQHETPAIGSVPVRTENATAAMKWQWGLDDIDPADLRAARKLYARRGHPDIARPGDRERATGRLAVVNRTIDDALSEVSAW